MKVKADLHNHLRTSSIFRDRDFNLALDLACKRLGKNGTFGMINFSDRRYEHFIELRGYDRLEVGNNGNAVYIPEKKVLVIKGQEIPTKQGHLLVLGLEKDKHMKEWRDVKDTVKEAKDNNGTIVLDHSFYKHGLGYYIFGVMPELLCEIDAIEVHNGEASLGIPFVKTGYSKVPNSLAKGLYHYWKKTFPDLGALSVSDGHSLYELGSSWTEINFPYIESKDKFNDSLRESVRKANLDSQMKMKKSRIGAIDHVLDLKFITSVAPKIGLGYLFETDRPDY
ncbi:hypothetical protein AUJ62_01190 [Candidatus Pacearchaeota archaeon CG1_02_32_21]|nr:MAG: hypothetical protein AUJ62_01190 [Candidatus Pacearchaeota archaeon CG1_02_32_21]